MDSYISTMQEIQWQWQDKLINLISVQITELVINTDLKIYICNRNRTCFHEIKECTLSEEQDIKLWKEKILKLHITAGLWMHVRMGVMLSSCS